MQMGNHKKKIGRGGKDRPPGIILRDQNTQPRKSPNLGPPSLAGRHRPLCNSLAEGGAQDVIRERAGHNEGIFLTKPHQHSFCTQM
jgi:hypothetical protein